MESKIIEEKRNELKSLYCELHQLHNRKKILEEDLLTNEKLTGKRERVARRRKGERDSSLPITMIALLSGFSRDKVYRLLWSGVLPDRHPVSIGQMIRAGHGFREVPLRYRDEYQAWKAIDSEKRNRNRLKVGRSVQERTKK